MMLEHYADVRLLHIAAVVLSGALFITRAIAVQAGAKIAMAPALRYASYAIDTVLLISALGLVWALRDPVLQSSWLWAKVALLPVYIVLGSFALKRGKTRLAKLGFFIAAVLTLVFMYRIARTHDPIAGLGLYLLP